MTVNDQGWLTPKQVAGRVQLSYATVLRAIKRGELVAHEMAGRIRISVEEYERWTTANPTSAPASRPRRGCNARPSKADDIAAELDAIDDED